MTGMGQKHAVGIVTTSFVAGLLATAIMFGPAGWSPARPLSFGLADEPIPEGQAATESLAAAWEWLPQRDLTAHSDPVLPQWLSWKSFKQASVGFFSRHLRPPARALAGWFAHAETPPQSRLTGIPDGHQSTPAKPASEANPAAAARAPASESPPANLGFSRFATSRSTDMRLQPPAAQRTRTGLPTTQATPPNQPRPMTLTAEETTLLERLVDRADRGPVAVTAFSGKPPAAEERDSSQRRGSESPSVLDKQPDSAALTAVPPRAASSEGSQLAAPGRLQAVEPSTQPEASGPSATSAATQPAGSAAATQGYVARETAVASPDSLRALVSRTQPADPPANLNQTAAVDPKPANEASPATDKAKVAELTATEATRVTAVTPVSETPRPQRKSLNRSERTARGLQSAAAALERAEQQPVKSLLTRTLGPDAAAPPQPTAVVAKQTSPVPVASPVEAITMTNQIRQPATWQDEAPARLEPRHARPQTVTAPSPPLQLETIGQEVVTTAPVAAAAVQQADEGAAWVDPEKERWTTVVAIPAKQPQQPVAIESPRERIVRRLSANQQAVEAARQPPPAPEPQPVTRVEPTGGEPEAEPPGKRLLDRLRPAERLRDRFSQREQRLDPLLPRAASPQTAWPPPTELLRQLETLAAEASSRPALYREVREWASQTTLALTRVLETSGPQADAAAAAVATLAAAVPVGMAVADQLAAAGEGDRASTLRRVAFAVKRRAVTWQAAAALAADWQAAAADNGSAAEVEQSTVDLVQLLAALERFEADPESSRAAEVQQAVSVVTAAEGSGSENLIRAVTNHYAAPNLRVSLREAFLTLLMPETTSRAESVRETVLGRPVRGRRAVEQTTSIELTPDADEICFNLVVDGDVSTYAITDTGPISMASRGAGQFKVEKPFKVCRQGLVVGPAIASATNRARLMNVSTSFDSVPLMGSLLRTLARNQHAENLPAANREVAQKIIWQSCQQTDEESERKFAELAGTVQEKVWNPLVRLGLNPSPFMETTTDTAILRLRLHAEAQLAAHTPRPREPENSLLGLQVHQSTLNNAFNRLNIGGHRLTLEDLFVRVQEQLGLDPAVPEDIPEGVSVTFEAVDPLRVEFTDGLVKVRVAIDALESGRRDWYDVIGRVSYKPVMAGNEVLLEREGPIRIGGPGHRGRIEFALRTIFGKIFPKERPLRVLPKRITEHPRLQTLAAVQAVSWDGWFAAALADSQPAQLETAAVDDGGTLPRR